MNVVTTILKGVLIGICFAIPGFSGGTMAVLLGVYRPIIEFVSLNKEKMKERYKTIILLFVGAAVGLLSFAKLIGLLLTDYPIPLYFAFIGLIIGGAPFVYRETEIKKPRLKDILLCLLGLAIVLGFYFIKPPTNDITTSLTFASFCGLFFSSIGAAFAMIIPGISGSFILLILGWYASIINAVNTFNIPLLIPVLLGVACGAVGGANVIKKLLAKYKASVYCVIFGMIVGSIVALYPGFSFDIEGLIAVILALLCAAASFLLSRGKTKKNEG